MQLFLVLTPYQIVLACALADWGATVIVIGDFENAEVMAKAIEQSGHFSSVHFLPGTFHTGPLQGRLRARKNTKLVADIYQTLGPDEVYISNDTRPEVQVLIRLAGRQTSDTIVTYVEDGDNAYRSDGTAPPSIWKVIAGKAVYGYWWTPRKIYGTSPGIENAAVLFPNAIRAELKHLNVKNVPRSRVLSVLKEEWWNVVIEGAAGMTVLPRDLEIILVTPGPELLGEAARYREEVRKVVSEGLLMGLKVAVKLHPRDSSGTFDITGKHPDVIMLPVGLPGELIAARSRSSLMLLAGPPSTLHLTTRWLLGSGTRVWAWRTEPDGTIDANLNALYRSVGVETAPIQRGLREVLGSSV